MNRLSPAAPMASPVANDIPTVTVLLIAFLPYARPGEAIREHYLFFRGRSRLQLHCIPEDCLFELLRGGPHQCASTPFIGAKTAHGKYSNSLLFSRSSGFADQPEKASGLAAKFQIARRSPLSLCLRLIPGAMKSSPWLAPVVGAFRGPKEIRRAGQALERPGGIVGNVGGKAKEAAGPQYARKHRNRAILHEPPFPMPTLRPWIGVEQIHLGKRGGGEPRHELEGVAGVKSDIVDGALLDRCKDLRHAVDEGLAADETNRRIGACLRDQILTAAESDFEANRLDGARKHLREFVRRRLTKYERQPRQQGRHEVNLTRPQPVTLAAADTGALAGRGMIIVARHRHQIWAVAPLNDDPVR